MWNDWKLDSKFLTEVIKYCEGHNQTFDGMVDSFIEKAEKGSKLLHKILASTFHSSYLTDLMMCICASLVPLLQLRLLLLV